MAAYNTFASGPRKGQPKTLTDRVVRYLLEGRQYQEVPNKSKYRKFIHPNEEDRGYFVGKAGAIRVGKSVGSSRSSTDKIQADMHLWEKMWGL